MEVILAKTAGFCFGVRRAVDKVYEQIDTDKAIYTLGPIIHNDEVVKDLEKRGVTTIASTDDLDKIVDGILIIRSHGVPKSVIDELDARNIEYIDMTCPFVKRIHGIVSEKAAFSDIVIIGSAIHPEVVGIKGWAGDNVTVIENVNEANEYIPKKFNEVTIVSQTTFNLDKFKELVEIIEEKGYDIDVVNTICDATRKRQSEARDISKNVDAMIVIGDKKSSNSKKLYEICSEECINTYFIQTVSELDFQPDMNVKSVGITAGASTPNNIIEEVQNNVRVNF